MALSVTPCIYFKAVMIGDQQTHTQTGKAHKPDQLVHCIKEVEVSNFICTLGQWETKQTNSQNKRHVSKQGIPSNEKLICARAIVESTYATSLVQDQYHP